MPYGQEQREGDSGSDVGRKVKFQLVCRLGLHHTEGDEWTTV